MLIDPLRDEVFNSTSCPSLGATTTQKRLTTFLSYQCSLLIGTRLNTRPGTICQCTEPFHRRRVPAKYNYDLSLSRFAAATRALYISAKYTTLLDQRGARLSPDTRDTIFVRSIAGLDNHARKPRIERRSVEFVLATLADHKRDTRSKINEPETYAHARAQNSTTGGED